MKGTFQGDYSRSLFDPRKHYRSVRMQQGRVQLDADWNEQADILNHRIRTGTVDLVGLSGGPAERAGFGLSPRFCLDLEASRQHFVLVGGTEGCTLPEPADTHPSRAGFTIEARVQARSHGTLFSQWLRAGEERRFRLACVLSLEQERLRFHRAGLEESDLVSEPVDFLHRTHHIAVVYRSHETVIFVDGEERGRDNNGFVLPSGRSLFLVGANFHEQRAHNCLNGSFYSLRLWNVARTRLELAQSRDPHCQGEASDAGIVADWRFNHDSGTEIRDHSSYGNHGVTRGDAGSLPRFGLGDVTLSAGRYYVDGILCENDDETVFSLQPEIPGLPFPRPRGQELEEYLFYLDVWERSVSAVEDPDIRETALGGPDTTTRARVVAQVRCLPLAGVDGEARPFERQEWIDLVEERRRGELRVRRQLAPATPLENLLYRVEIHNRGDAYGSPRSLDGSSGVSSTVEVDPQNPKSLVLSEWAQDWQPGHMVEVFSSASTPPQKGGTPPQKGGTLAMVVAVTARRALEVDTDLASLSDQEGLRIRAIATFKWSRANASIAFPIAEVDPGNRLVTLLAQVPELVELEAGSWVEVVDDPYTLRGETAHLCRVKEVDVLHHRVRLDRPPPVGVGAREEHHPFLRLWDQRGAEVTSQGVIPVRAGVSQRLESGIEVQFEGNAPYRGGDYWMIPVRAQGEEVHWPLNGDGVPVALPPHGVTHHYVPLALLSYQAGRFELDDLRTTFRPLSTGAVSKAGDWVEGDLGVRGEMDVQGDLFVRGRATVGELHGPLATPGIVESHHLVDGSVTPEKISPEVGLIPWGYFILGPTSDPPPGFVYTGSVLTLFNEESLWVDRLEIPEGGPPGPLKSAVLDGKVYTFLESGDVWCYEPVTNSWQRRRDMPLPRRSFAVVPLEGQIHVLGGLDRVGRSTDSHLSYEPTRDEWTERASLPVARGSLAAVAWDRQIYALGGVVDSWWGRRLTRRHEAYDPLTETWVNRCPLPRCCAGVGAATLGGKIHVLGGEVSWLFGHWGRTLTRKHRQYHPGSDRWLDESTPLPTPRRDLGLATMYGKLFAVGGRGPFGWLDDCDRFDPATGGWSSDTPLHEPIDGPGVATVAGALYVTGAMRSPGTRGVLVEENRLARRYYVHQRTLGDTLLDEALP